MTTIAAEKATYVSVWDGSSEVHTRCRIDLSTKPPLVTDVEYAADSGNWTSLDEERIDLADGTEIRTFDVEDDYRVVDGQAQHDVP